MQNRKIQCITFPRSGHHLLVNILLKYFSENIFFPEISDTKVDKQCNKVVCGGDFHYCEYYHHCRTSPCADPRTNFQKNHDFDGRVQNCRNNYYVIQYRHPLECLISFFEWWNARARKHKTSQEDWFRFIYGNPSKKLSLGHAKYWIKKNVLISYSHPFLQSWRFFVKKWIIENKNPNTYTLLYDDLIHNSLRKAEEVIKFINPEKLIKIELIRDVCKHTTRQKKRDITKYRYWDYKLFRNMERHCYKEIKILDLPAYFD